MADEADFIPLRVAVLTVSDSRTEATDESGRLLADRLEAAGHAVAERRILADDIYAIRALVSRWIAEADIDAVIATGGTGLTGRDSTPEAVQPLFDKPVDGFGEIFRAVSFEEIGTSALQSRAVAGVANRTFLFVLPGSPGACRSAFDRIIRDQLDHRTRPCNLVELRPRLDGP
jgi:molybdenum cofactor biosynthesis protein B